MNTHTTSDYSIFTLDGKNRGINMGQVRKIRKDMSNRGFIEAFPIVVTPTSEGKFKVCDGQHRLEAAKSIGIPICYYISDFEIDPATVPASKSWAKSDFIHRFATQGIPEYVKVIAASKEFGVSITTATLILHDDMGNNKAAAVQAGNMNIPNEKQSLQILQAAAEICKINKALLVNSVAKTLQRLIRLDSISFEELTRRVINNAAMINRFTNVNQGVTEMEAAYNYKLSYDKRVPIDHELRAIMARRKSSFGKS